MKEIVFLALAGLILLGTFAPIIPLLHRLPKVGAPRVSVALSFEPRWLGDTTDLVIPATDTGVPNYGC